MSNYRIITSSSEGAVHQKLARLETLVIEQMKHGWLPCGGLVIIGNTWFAQAMYVVGADF